VPQIWTGILGLVPIAIGISHLVNQEKDGDQVQAVSDEADRSQPIHLLVF